MHRQGEHEVDRDPQLRVSRCGDAELACRVAVGEELLQSYGVIRDEVATRTKSGWLVHETVKARAAS